MGLIHTGMLVPKLMQEWFLGEDKKIRKLIQSLAKQFAFTKADYKQHGRGIKLP